MNIESVLSFVLPLIKNCNPNAHFSEIGEKTPKVIARLIKNELLPHRLMSLQKIGMSHTNKTT
jgi:hypothetical protein